MNYETSEFNRAVQAKRQPGSAFKPIIFSAAIDKGYTPATMILDAPVVFDDPSNDKIWRPKNYSGKFYGEIPFRTALIHSHNVVTVKILQDIGIDYVIDYARKVGIASELTRDSTLALGSSVVTPIELNTAYAVFASGGAKPTPVFVQKIVGRDGQILERSTVFDPTVDFVTQVEALKKEVAAARIEAIVSEDDGDESDEGVDAEATDIDVVDTDGSEVVDADKPVKYRIIRPKQVISEETAYIATHLLSEVVRFGTGFRVRALNRPTAGKTGTTNENIDAWFVGFTPELVTTAWVGFDGKRSLGKLETGSRAASPMWLRFMKEAVGDKPKKAFAVPAGITFSKIDPKTGKLANDKTEKPILEAFRDGTEPSDQTDDKKSGTANKFFLEE
jgi:penicillin-binding protein 1A